MEEGMDLCAVCSFLTASVIQYHAMNKTLANLWHPHGGVTISDLGEKRFMFRFYYEIDFDRFLQVQIHDLPSGLINENMGRHFGNFIGDFLEYDTKAVGRGYRGFMRIRERIDIRGPLKQRKKIILSPKKNFLQEKGDSVGVGFVNSATSKKGNYGDKLLALRGRGNVDPNVVPVDEDSSMEIREGEKRPHKFVFSTISMGMDSEKIVGERSNARISDLLAGSVGQSSRAL
ncbi:hypothetical protein Golax_016952 [Gossypium laxum]|uniref:DUF4283 domain-containing protein n=1 Tax=Gossypium laxum TaxID=34288 RepID=A0A7J8YZE9_9ROSI|nr:hypothetical protein [Gossypium laxum]